MPSIRATTRLAAVIGWPVHHSLSPAMQNAAIEDLGLDWIYVALAVRPEGLAAALAGARAIGMVGLSVTIPHKQAVMGLLDRIDPVAEAIGAVNTVHFTEDGGSVGYNTDAEGYVRTVEAESAARFAGATVLQIGAGGAGRAMAAGALAAGAARLLLHNRTAKTARELAATLRERYPSSAVESVEEGDLIARSGEAGIIANATSLGLREGDALPLPEVALRPGQVVFDTVYNPAETPLLAAARRAGALPVGGLGMLARQGARALEIWSRGLTDRRPDEGLMLSVLRRHFGLE
jgi:shikimate dehydrogenase